MSTMQASLQLVTTFALLMWAIWRINRLHAGEGGLIRAAMVLFSVSVFGKFLDSLATWPKCSAMCNAIDWPVTMMLVAMAIYLWRAAWLECRQTSRHPA